jgi:FkbM family methyltransferase
MIQFCGQLGWKPDIAVLCGVGLQDKEVDLFHENWPDVPLVGFEPHPETFKYLKTEFPGELYPYALSRKAGQRKIRCRRLHKNGASLFPRLDETDQEHYWAEVKRLDEFLYLLKNKERCLLWLDCEGSELNILKGGREFVENGVVIINVEMTGRPQHAGWPPPKEVHQHLCDLGFVAVWIHSIRTQVCQYDAIYLRKDLVDETMRVYGNP